MNDKDIHNFEAYWDLLSEDEKAGFIRTAGDLGPDSAIQAALKGIDSYHSLVRTQARESLKQIQAGLLARLETPADHDRQCTAMKESAQVCSRIFSRIRPGLSFEDQDLLLKTLVGFKGKGPYFAFKALCMKRIPLASVEKIIPGLPDPQRLALIREYLKTTPELRLKFGAVFRQTARSIQDKEAAVHFYAGLFDAKEDMDPFLYNLAPDLRDPDRISSGFVRSGSPETRARGLKALAMTMTKISPGLLKGMLETETDPMVRQTLYQIIENSALGTYPELFHPILSLLEKTAPKKPFTPSKP
nr:hypothetical protein [Desulfobacula sp.]